MCEKCLFSQDLDFELVDFFFKLAPLFLTDRLVTVTSWYRYVANKQTAVYYITVGR